MEQVIELAKGLTAPVLASFVAAVGAYLIYQMVFKGKRFVNPNGNGKSVERGEGMVTAQALATLHEDMRALSGKMDELRLEVVGKYVTKDSLEAIGNRLDAVRERAIRAETKIEMMGEQMADAFRRINALETKKRKQEEGDNG